MAGRPGALASIDRGELDAVLSFYVLQELHEICAKPADDEERLIHRRRFTIRDPSDEPHVIAALLSGCDAIVTYDTHFDGVRSFISVHTPEELTAL